MPTFLLCRIRHKIPVDDKWLCAGMQSMNKKLDFVCHPLIGEHCFYSGRVPENLLLTASQFQALWDEHPDEFHEIMIHGRPVRTPRWQQAYGRNYEYTGRVNQALPMLPALVPFLEWTQQNIDSRLNGVLVNWYDGAHRHYIGRHRDSTTNIVVGGPIVTISLGDARTFRVRPWRGIGYWDFAAVDGAVFVMPYDTNLAYTHEVPHSAKTLGHRISITVRAFAGEGDTR